MLNSEAKSDAICVTYNAHKLKPQNYHRRLKLPQKHPFSYLKTFPLKHNKKDMAVVNRHVLLLNH
jgi:hypothetical protein